MDGIEATRHITAGAGTCRVLILTTFDLDEHVYDAFRSGASGFLLKTVSPEDLATAVRAVHTGDTLVAPVITRLLIECFTSAPTERGPAAAVADRARAGRAAARRPRLSNGEIAAELYLSQGTVKTHVGRILANLEIRYRIQAVVLAYETAF